MNACPCGKGRCYPSEHAANKALGRVQTRRKRLGDARGTRRGLVVENRCFECPEGYWHLTNQSRRRYLEVMA